MNKLPDYTEMMPPPLPPTIGGHIGAMPSVQDNSTIAGMRWNGDQLILQLYKLLGDYDVKVDDQGGYVFVRVGNNKPRINDKGLQSVMAFVQGVVNPFVSLSNLTNDDANILINQQLVAFACSMLENQHEWEIREPDMSLIMSIVKGITYNQQKRAVEGHESSNFRTQTFEQNVQQQYTQNQPQGGGFLASFKPSFMQGGRR